MEEDMVPNVNDYNWLVTDRRAELLREAEAYRLAKQATARAVADKGPLHLRGRLPNTQLLYLFVSSFIILFVGMGLFPVLPVYAAEFGASRTVIGIYYALMYAA